MNKIDLDRLQDWLDKHLKVKASLEEVGFGVRHDDTDGKGDVPEIAVDLLATYAGQGRDLSPWTRDAQINTDRNLRLQYLAGLALNANISARIFNDILSHYQFPDNLLEGSGLRLAVLRKLLQETGRRPRERPNRANEQPSP